MKRLFVNTKDCSGKTLEELAIRSGFIIKNGRKHCKVETGGGKFVAMIPRHNPLKRETAKGVVKSLNAFGANINFI